ncbi:MAG: hypothetical protein HKL87_02490 [Acidimicrobiaceae bacterium]|nr:hypothetical protein [Acidimicrobiaceae bacterium]
MILQWWRIVTSFGGDDALLLNLECDSKTLASSGELDGLWDSIIVPPTVKNELPYHAALSLAVRPILPFAVTDSAWEL